MVYTTTVPADEVRGKAALALSAAFEDRCETKGVPINSNFTRTVVRSPQPKFLPDDDKDIIMRKTSIKITPAIVTPLLDDECVNTRIVNADIRLTNDQWGRDANYRAEGKRREVLVREAYKAIKLEEGEEVGGVVIVDSTPTDEHVQVSVKVFTYILVGEPKICSFRVSF